MNFYLSKADLAREVAKRLNHKNIDARSDQDVLTLSSNRRVDIGCGDYLSFESLTIGEIIDMIDEIRAEHSKKWQFREK